MATSQYTDRTQLVGALKDQYAKKIKDLRTKTSIIQEIVPFESRELISNLYHQPVVVTHNHGHFYDLTGGSRTMPDNPVAMQTKDLQVPGYEITERFKIPFGQISALNAGNAGSFMNTQTLKMVGIQKAMLRDVEWSSLQGTNPVCNVTAAGAYAGGQLTLTLDTASVPEAFLCGLEGSYLDLYTAVASGTLVNAVAQLEVAAVVLPTDTASGTITVIANSTDAASIAALNTNAGPTTAVPAYLYRRSTYGYEQPGLIYQAKNTGSLFGVTYSGYSLLQAVQVHTVGQPSMKKVLGGVAMAQARGLETNLTLLSSHKGFNALMSDMSALRRIGGGDYKTSVLQNGAEKVEFYSSNGSISVVGHGFIKNGEMLAIVPENLARIGSTDITDQLGGEDLSVMGTNVNALEFRLFTNQAVVNIAPAQTVYFDGLTYA